MSADPKECAAAGGSASHTARPQEISAVERLLALPEVFHLQVAARQFGMPAPQLQIYLARWQAKGLVAPAGPRASVYFNTLRNPAAPQERLVDALLVNYESATLIGESVLHAAGWITQVPRKLHVAVLKRASFVQHHGVELHGKSAAWFAAARDHLLAPKVAERSGVSSFGLRMLEPAHALASLYADPKAWHPDPDDLYLPDDRTALEAAFEHWGVLEALPGLLASGEEPARYR